MAEPLVHLAPFLAEATAITPTLWLAHAVPLVIDLDTLITGMSNIAARNRIARRNSVGWGRRGVTRRVVVLVRHGRRVGRSEVLGSFAGTETVSAVSGGDVAREDTPVF